MSQEEIKTEIVEKLVRDFMNRPVAKGLTPEDDFSILVRDLESMVRNIGTQGKLIIEAIPDQDPPNSGLIMVRLPGTQNGHWSAWPSVLAKVDCGRVVRVWRTVCAGGHGEPPAELFQY
jgi:hypothetical protein